MSDAYAGGCAYGEIRYEISDEPMFENDCQCRDRQRMSGAGHGSYLTFSDKGRVKLEGEAMHWDIVGDSGNAKTRAFCPTCGPPVYLTSIINPPQSCIIAVGAGEERAIVKDGKIEVATMMTVTMSCDHRVVDGATGARFLQTLKQFVEDRPQCFSSVGGGAGHE